MSFERVGSEVAWEGRIATVRRERWRQADGEVVDREVVGHPGAVGIVAWDGEHVWLVRQPREAVGDPALLEVPAGKLDEEGETPLQTAQRELAEEIGKRAARWREIERFHTSPGFTDEEVVLFAAQDLEDVPDFEPDPGERIEILRWPLRRLDDAIAECCDSKSLIALMWLRDELR
ncbi:MAG: NUDIX hydrolase [Actinomycetota bacterium]|nr:NUDIX hydrolase [Actinomycetota bacterium]